MKAILVLAAAISVLAATPSRIENGVPRVREVRHVNATLLARVTAAGDQARERTHLEASRSAIRHSPGRLAPVPHRATGQLEFVPVPRGPRTPGRTVTYTLEIERGLPIVGSEVARTVADVLADRRGWRTAAGVRFVAVSRRAAKAGAPVDVRITLASPGLVDRLCAPLGTAGELSCWRGGRAVLNARRWVGGARTFGADVEAYRIYLINHEVGHAVGRPHEECPRKGHRAPVMVQQTKALDGCVAWPWPVRA